MRKGARNTKAHGDDNTKDTSVHTEHIHVVWHECEPHSSFRTNPWCGFSPCDAAVVHAAARRATLLSRGTSGRRRDRLCTVPDIRLEGLMVFASVLLGTGCSLEHDDSYKMSRLRLRKVVHALTAT